MLPPPPAAAATTPAAVAETAPVASTTTETKTDATVVAGFGPGRGDNKIAVPTICDYAGVIDAMHAAVVASGLDFASVLKVYDETPKSSYPGNKDGRACYNLGNILKNLDKTHAALHQIRQPKEKKARVKSSEVFKATLNKLVSSLGVSPERLKEILGADAEQFLAAAK